MLAVGNAMERAFLVFMASVALRSEAVSRLQVDHVTTADGVVVPEFVVLEKNSRHRRVTLSAPVRAAIADWLATDGRTPDRTRRLFAVTTPRLLQRLVRKAGLTGRRNPHQFRTFLVDHALAGGSTPHDVSAYLDHHDVATTLKYYASNPPPSSNPPPPSLDALIEWESMRILELRGMLPVVE